MQPHLCGDGEGCAGSGRASCERGAVAIAPIQQCGLRQIVVLVAFQSGSQERPNWRPPKGFSSWANAGGAGHRLVLEGGCDRRVRCRPVLIGARESIVAIAIPVLNLRCPRRPERESDRRFCRRRPGASPERSRVQLRRSACCRCRRYRRDLGAEAVPRQRSGPARVLVPFQSGCVVRDATRCCFSRERARSPPLLLVAQSSTLRRRGITAAGRPGATAGARFGGASALSLPAFAGSIDLG